MAGGDKDAANVYMTGAEVMIDAPVSGDLFAAAGRISVDHPVSGDAVLAAGWVVSGYVTSDGSTPIGSANAHPAAGPCSSYLLCRRVGTARHATPAWRGARRCRGLGTGAIGASPLGTRRAQPRARNESKAVESGGAADRNPRETRLTHPAEISAARAKGGAGAPRCVSRRAHWPAQSKLAAGPVRSGGGE